MELREYARILRKNWALVVVMAILGLAAGAGASLLATPKYESHTQLYVSVRSDAGSTSDLVQGASFSRQIVNSYVAVIRTGLVLDPVVEQLQLEMTGAQLASYVSASTPSNSALIKITVTSPSSGQAALIANAVGDSLKEVVQTQLEPETAVDASPISLTTTQVALEPSGPVSPNVLMNLALGLLIGLALGVGIALLRSILDTRIYSLQDLEEITDKPLIGGIIDDPHASKNRLIVHTQPRSPRAESFRALRTNLQFLNVSSPSRVFAITSANAHEGKTTTALNLALALSQAGASVALVDGDLRMPRISEHLEIEGGAGLTDVLIGKADLVDVLQRWGQTQLYALPAGRIPPNPSELLGSSEMEATIKTLEGQFDYVIIDAPPALAVTDAAVISKMTAGLLMVVASGSTTRQSFEGAMSLLETAGADVLGVIVTMLPTKGPDSYGYGYGYGYGEDLNEEGSTTAGEGGRRRAAGKKKSRRGSAK